MVDKIIKANMDVKISTVICPKEGREKNISKLQKNSIFGEMRKICKRILERRLRMEGG